MERLTLTAALDARPALRWQMGELLWEQALKIAADPRPEVITRQNSIWLRNDLRRVFLLLHREEPTLAAEARRIVAVMDRYTASIPQVDNRDLFADRQHDTWGEHQGEW